MFGSLTLFRFLLIWISFFSFQIYVFNVSGIEPGYYMLLQGETKPLDTWTKVKYSMREDRNDNGERGEEKRERERKRSERKNDVRNKEKKKPFQIEMFR